MNYTNHDKIGFAAFISPQIDFYLFLIIEKRLKIHQLNIIKTIKTGYKKTCEIYQRFSKEEKEKKLQCGRKQYKIFLNMKRKCFFSIEKNYKMRKNK